MVKLVGMALLLALGVCGYLLLHGAVESPATLELREPRQPGATFGGMYRRELGNMGGVTATNG